MFYLSDCYTDGFVVNYCNYNTTVLEIPQINTKTANYYLI